MRERKIFKVKEWKSNKDEVKCNSTESGGHVVALEPYYVAYESRILNTLGLEPSGLYKTNHD